MENNLSFIKLKEKLEIEFQQAGISEIADIDWIVCEITGKRRSELPLIKNFSQEEMLKILNAVSLRLENVPLGYIFGKTNFYGYDFVVSKAVLIPRLDTEILVERILNDLKHIKNPVSILDIGTGSGAIAVVLKKETNQKVTAVDISEEALEIAKQNAKNNNVEIEFDKSDIFENLRGRKFDIIVSNPPYIETKVINNLTEDVKNFEPHLALDGGEDGLDFYRKIIALAPEHLNKNGKLYFEIGYNQAEAVSTLMKDKFINIEVLKDYEGNNRVVLGEFYD